MTIDNCRSGIDAQALPIKCERIETPALAQKCGQIYPKAELDERVDYSLRGCRKCGAETRAYTTFMGADFCDKCIGIVTQLEALHMAFNRPCECGESK